MVVDIVAFSFYRSVSPGCPQWRVAEVNIVAIDLNTKSP
jgi:hypothetical protein